MILKKSVILFLSAIAFSSMAKTPMTICSTATSDNFPSGTGTQASPYLICNTQQFNRIERDKLYTSHFMLGSDINFHTQNITPIDSTAESPFSASFNGNGYTLKNITIEGHNNYHGIFAYLKDGSISNLNINNIAVSFASNRRVGGLIGSSENATINNVHITQLNLGRAPDRSGGLIGSCVNSTVSASSVQGELTNSFGADGSGGLIGLAMDSSISNSSSDILIKVNTKHIRGISAIGGLVGFMSNTSITDAFVFGLIDYSFAENNSRAELFGGLVGQMTNNSTINNAYFVGDIIANADKMGAVVGNSYNINPADSSGVFWNRDVTAIDNGLIGQGITTSQMGTTSFWVGEGYNASIWQLVEGLYPDLN
jgi:hypothetical protein